MQENNSYIKRRRKRRKRNRTIKGVMLLLCILLALLVIVIVNREDTDVSLSYRTESFVSKGNNDIENSNINEENDKDWCLILVNKWHPFEGDLEIELTELSNGECVDSRIYPQLQQMFDDMRSEGVYPVVASGYRTAQKQQEIYDNKYAEYIAQGYSEASAKTETERWVAVVGTSEHQLGLGIDINADGVHSYGSQVYNWLSQNAYRYGFIYRYQEDKVNITGVANEPWHYRYVGVDVATEIYERNICLEEYLGEIDGGM